MIAIVQMPPDHSGSYTIQDACYVDTTFTPHDRTTYRVITWVVWRSDGPSRFFAIARLGTPITGAFVPLTPDCVLIDYVELFAVSQDMGLELLWAGWRALLYITGRGTIRRRPATCLLGALTGMSS
jgi:hypothetical protein